MVVELKREIKKGTNANVGVERELRKFTGYNTRKKGGKRGKGRAKERKSGDLGDAQKRLRWMLNRIDSRRKLRSVNSVVLLLKWISAVVLFFCFR